MTAITVSAELLRRLVDKLRSLAGDFNAAVTDLNQALGIGGPCLKTEHVDTSAFGQTAVHTDVPAKRHFSAATKAKMAASQRKRWAKAKKTKMAAPSPPLGLQSTVRKLSPEGLKRIREAQKKRWAKAKAKTKSKARGKKGGKAVMFRRLKEAVGKAAA